MELDQLKPIWQQHSAEPVERKESILAMMHKQSNNAIAKMTKNLLAEAIFVIIGFGSIVVFYFVSFKGKFAEMAWLYLLLGIFYVVYFIYKYKLLKQMECVACQVKSNMERQIKILKRYVQFYLWSGTLLVPLVLMFIIILFGSKIPEFKNDNILFISPENPLWKVILIWAALFAVTMIPIHFLNKWYVHKLYGQHIKKLLRIVNEMQEE